jgi:tetrahydromethanopterin S-methyltransferase subunit B
VNGEYGRRANDLPEVVAVLKRDMEHLITQLRDIAEQMRASVADLRDAHSRVLADHEKRIDSLEGWRDRQQGAAALLSWSFAKGLAIGTFLVGLATVLLKLEGRL